MKNLTGGVRPAERYTACPDLWCVTTYFNPGHLPCRRANYDAFAAPLREAGIPLLTVEGAFGDDPFDLPVGSGVIQVRCRDVLWQKERLINMGIQSLPAQATKVAWLDCDVLFANPDWAVATAAMLDEFVVVQPWERAVRCGENNLAAEAYEDEVPSFASSIAQNPKLLHEGNFVAHGHTGYAWAARRDLLDRYGLYEMLICGNGDHHMAHAFLGDLDSHCVRRLRYVARPASQAMRPRRSVLVKQAMAIVPIGWRQWMYRMLGLKKSTGSFWGHFQSWARLVGQDCGRRIGWVPGDLLHLWHADGGNNRNYFAGWVEVHRYRFDPLVDVRIGPSGCLEWASDKPGLRRWAREYLGAGVRGEAR